MGTFAQPVAQRSGRTRRDRGASWLGTALTLVALLWASGCAGSQAQLASTPTAPPKTLVFYAWTDYMPQTVLDAFAAETGITVTYLTYGAAEEARNSIIDGLSFDVAVIDNDQLSGLEERGLLADIDFRHVPNFKNISPTFRDLAFDRGNKHSVPYGWGTTGLLVRSDLLKEPVQRWSDLWDRHFDGAILTREQPSEALAIALKALGYPHNSQDPQQLAAARDRLIALKPALQFVDPIDDEKAIAPLLNGEGQIMIGWAGDAVAAQAQNPAVIYVLPEEGTILWGDSLVISAKSTQRGAAERFIDFTLRPEIGGQIISEIHYATANQAALPYVNAEIGGNPIIYPAAGDLARATWYEPLSPAGYDLYDRTWQEVLSAP